MMIKSEFIAILKQWFEYLNVECGYSKHTIDAYNSDVQIFFKFIVEYLQEDIDEKLLCALTVKDFRAWIAHKMKKKYNNSSIVRALSSVKNLYGYLALIRDDDKILSNICAVIAPKKDKLLPKALTLNEISSLLEVLDEINFDNINWIKLRDKSIILLIYGAGLRISEALSLTEKQIKTDYLLIDGKGKKQRIVPLLPEIYQIVKHYIDKCVFNIDGKKIFRGKRGGELSARIVQLLIEKIRNILSLPNSVTPHALRHSFATHIFTECKNIRNVQTLLGHKKVTSTEIYTKVEQNLLLQQYNQFHPKGEE